MNMLAKNDVVRCRNADNDLTGVVLAAGNTSPQSVAVYFRDAEGIRMNGGLAITNMLPLVIDYERETVADLFGNEWEIDVAEKEYVNQ